VTGFSEKVKRAGQNFSFSTLASGEKGQKLLKKFLLAGDD